MELFNYFAIPLLLTISIESIVLILLREKRMKVLIFSVFLNCITNLSLNLILYFFGTKTIEIYFSRAILLEIVVWTIEGFAYYGLLKDKKTAIKYALLCNMTSFLLGLLIQLF